MSGTLVKDGAFRPGVAPVLRVIGIVLLASGGVALARGGGPGMLGVTAPGQVVEVGDDDSKSAVPRSYDARIRFTAGDGRMVEVSRRFRHPRRRSSRRLAVGDRVTVGYFPSAPEKAEAHDSRAAWAGGTVPALVGALLTAVSFAGRRPGETATP